MFPSPDLSAPLGAWILLGPVIILGFFLPGYLTFRFLPSPLPWVTSFLGSGLVLFGAVLLLEATPLRLNLFTLGSLLALAALIGWRMRGSGNDTPACRFRNWRPDITWRNLGCEWWWAVPALIAFASVLLHTVFEPLSGFDNFFRWNYLSLLMASQGSLAHYPPVTATDFHFYPWCDGIPPLIPMTNLWIYLGTSSTASTLVLGRVIVELSLTLGLVWHLARNLWGSQGARFSVLALSTSTLFLGSMGMEQETGMCGISFLAIAALLISYRKNPATATAVWAALAAAFGALCRDYNLILIPLALLGLVLAKAPRRHVFYALAAAATVTSPWYIRNAWLTGNFLFPQDFGGLLPTNPVHHAFMDAIQATYTYAEPGLRWALAGGLFISAGMLLVLALPGLVSRKFGARVIAFFSLVSLGLCLASVPSTAGGPYYALRVFGTGLPLLAALAGRWATWLSRRALVILGICLLPFSADAARRSWVYVWDPGIAPWPYTWTHWQQISDYVQASRHNPIWANLAAVAGMESIVVMSPNHHVLLGRAGGRPLPIFSAEIQALTDTSPTASFSTAIATLRRHHVRLVVLPDDKMQTARFLQTHPITKRLLCMPPAFEQNGLRFYDLARIERSLKSDKP